MRLRQAGWKGLYGGIKQRVERRIVNLAGRAVWDKDVKASLSFVALLPAVTLVKM